MEVMRRLGTVGLSVLMLAASAFAHSDENTRFWVQISASNKFERSKLTELGVSIEGVRSDSVWAFADEESLKLAREAGFQVLGKFPLETGRGGHHGDLSTMDFPGADSAFHNYAELVQELQSLEKAHSDIAKVVSIGKSNENRDLWALHINSDANALTTGKSGKPGSVFMGAHHAREHLSVEIPLMLAQHLLKNRSDAQIKTLLDERDIWIIPMVNPDGAEYDIAGTQYRLWRKNRRDNGNRTFGVDLNRNYSYQWGTGGSSSRSNKEDYKGPSAFSEPESSAIRDLVRSLPNVKTLLSFHTYSELILYPWGHSHSEISVKKDLDVFKKMATTMSTWNGYTPQQSSELYIASGDTTDWAYGELGIFAFTFELSPAGGGLLDIFEDPRKKFYPGASVIDRVFQDNLKPCLYMMQVADDPYQVVGTVPSGFLTNYVQPVSAALISSEAAF